MTADPHNLFLTRTTYRLHLPAGRCRLPPGAAATFGMASMYPPL